MENNIKKNNHSTVIIAVLCAALLGVSIAYAAMSSTFNLTFGQVATNALTWNVGFEAGEVSPIAKASSTATVCGTATVTTSTVSVENITLNALNDKCVYKLKVKNTGGVPAELSTVVPKTPSGSACDTTKTSEMTCGNVTYKLTTDEEGLSLIGLGNTIAQTSGTLDLYLVAEFTGTELEKEESQTAGGFAITFSQK